ncbi:MAG: 50S ribosomal protein L11 methyltransferase [Sphingobium sp.]
MSEQDDSAWIVTLPCTRADAERLTDADPFGEDEGVAPVLTFVEETEDDPESWLLQAYFDGKPPRAMLARIRALIPGAPAPKAEKVETQDWVAMSQDGMPPISAGRFHVRNSAADPRADGQIDFLIPASRAFGTGQHETTHGCLLMLDSLRAAGHRFGNIADIGTGTGLLAFAALALWPRAHAIASDIDPEAVVVTRDNIALNGLSEGNRPGEIALAAAAGTDHPAINARAPYDLIIANILAGPLIALAPAFAAHLEEGGSLILAGLLDEQADAVLAACRRAGLRLAGRTVRGRWPTLHLRKRRRSGYRRAERLTAGGDSETPGFGSW